MEQCQYTHRQTFTGSSKMQNTVSSGKRHKQSMSPVKTLYGLPSFIGEMNRAQRNGLTKLFLYSLWNFSCITYDAEVASPALPAIQMKSVVREVVCS